MTYDDLLEARDWAERTSRELSDELVQLEESDDEWYSCYQEWLDAENEVHYLQERLDTGDYED